MAGLILHDRPITVACSSRKEQDRIVVGEIRHSQAPLLLCKAQTPREGTWRWRGESHSPFSPTATVHFTRQRISESCAFCLGALGEAAVPHWMIDLEPRDRLGHPPVRVRANMALREVSYLIEGQQTADRLRLLCTCSMEVCSDLFCFTELGCHI